MTMLVIHGRYRIIGSRRDGGSLRFYPDDPANWAKVDGPHRVRRNASGGGRLRLDGIAQLETHYPTPRGELRQPRRFGRAAVDEMISWFGFTEVTRDSRGYVLSSNPEYLPGYVLTRGADVHGRCVALAGRGDPPAEDGTRIHVDVPMLQRTVNYHQLARGLAYPTFYRRLFPDLRVAMADVASNARYENIGLWRKDVTVTGAEIDGIRSLTTGVVILPKLFRRVADYLVLGAGDPSLAGLRDYLAQRDDRLFVMSRSQWTGFDTVVEVVGQRIRLTTPSEDLIFEER